MVGEQLPGRFGGHRPDRTLNRDALIGRQDIVEFGWRSQTDITINDLGVAKTLELTFLQGALA